MNERTLFYYWHGFSRVETRQMLVECNAEKSEMSVYLYEKEYQNSDMQTA